ncbi:MAG: gamma-glutamyltransferase family protein, partial [Alphaproteobacteria bacterium]|nr:gamma-glutamyltransferase family protein [Alphaproteobacteria bacterium]
QQGAVATAHPLATDAGLTMLKLGGNAVDAAVSSAFAIGVVEPDGSGIGGGGGMVIYLNGKREAHYINYYQCAPMNVNKINYDNESDRHTGKAILVPGTVAGLTMALARFGTLPLETVMEPAIRLAEQGFECDRTLATLILDNQEMLAEHSAAAAIFLDEGFPRMEGDLLVQPALAATLKAIAESGPDAFYKGPIAEAIAAEVQRQGGVMTAADLASYQAELTAPLVGTYRGYQIVSAAAPQSGSTVIEALNILENANLREMGHYTVSAPTLHLMAETFRRVYADRWQYLGDLDNSYVPVRGFLSKQFALERYIDINQFRAEPKTYRQTQAANPAQYDFAGADTAPDKPSVDQNETGWSDEEDEGKSSYDDWGEDVFDSWGSKKSKKEKDTTTAKKAPAPESKSAKDTTTADDDTDVDDSYEVDGHTTHLSVMDKDGNMVALTQTLGTFFGSGIVAEGVLLNCGMSNFSKTAAVNIIEPGKQPRSSISPTVILKDNHPLMVLGSPGASRIITTVVELIVNAIDFGMGVQQLNETPRFYCQKYEDHLFLEGGISSEVKSKLEKMGHDVRAYSTLDLFFGGAQVVAQDTLTGDICGSADPRRGGQAGGFEQQSDAE